MRRRPRCAAILLLALAAACKAPPPGALAVYDGGFVSQAELDARIAQLPANLRLPPEGDTASWRARLIRELAVEEIVLAQAADESPPMELERRIEELRRQVAVAAYLDERLPPREPISEEDLRAAYDEWLPAYRQAERRLVHHIFLTAGDDAAAAAAEERMRGLRERVLNGEELARLAAESSDSESRHRDGVLGWFARGQLDPRLEEVVFQLPLQQPSEPIRTGSGVHLLWVEAVAGGREHSFEEVRNLVERRLANRRREGAARELVVLEPPPGSFVPDQGALATLLQEGDPGSLILRVGAFELRLADLRARLADLGSPTAPMDIVRALETRELLYLQCLEAGCDRGPRVAERLARLESETLVQHELRERLLQRAKGDRVRLEEYYARNRNRYLEPVRWRLSRVTVPLGPDPAARMRRLESAVADLDAGAVTLEGLAAELDGAVESLGWTSLPTLRVEVGVLRRLLPELEEGSHTPPYRTERGLEIVRCDERLSPAPVALERVESAVVADLVEHEEQALYEALVEELLAARRFRPLD